MALFGIPMDLRTTYSVDYTKKEGISFPQKIPDDLNCVSYPYLQYLVPDRYQYLLPPAAVYEDAKCVAHRAHITDYTPDEALLDDVYARRDQSKYQSDFCKVGDYESKKTRDSKTVPLPPTWEMPLSSQRCSYRDPRKIANFSLKPTRAKRQKDNLVPILAEREILQVRTGDTEYEQGVGKLGDFILREKMFGERQPKGITQWEAKRRLAALEQEGVDITAE